MTGSRMRSTLHSFVAVSWFLVAKRGPLRGLVERERSSSVRDYVRLAAHFDQNLATDHCCFLSLQTVGANARSVSFLEPSRSLQVGSDHS